jgi:Threonine dehydrogenase and related Zn-dependent dehydrogenases
MSTGYHAAVSADTEPGDVVCVVGDGAVAVCAVLAARLLGAERVIVLGSHHPVRQDLMRVVGADEVLSARGEEVAEEVATLTHGAGADAVLECVGSAQSFTTAIAIAGPGATVGYVGLPHGVTVDPAAMFARNIRLAGGMAPARAIIPMLLPQVLDGSLRPGTVFTSRHDLDDLPAAYAELDERIGVKPLIDVHGVRATG